MQHNWLAVHAGVNPVGVEAAREGAVALGDGLGQSALQNAQPVAVARDFVLRVHSRHGIFQIQNRRQGCFEHQVAHARRIGLANRRIAVDHQIQVQAVVLQQHRRGARGSALETDELRLVQQAAGAAVLQADNQATSAHAVGHSVQVRAAAQGHGAVQHAARIGNDFFAPLGVVGFAAGAAFARAAFFGNHIGAVERVVQAAPAGIGRVQRVTGVEYGNHQLRSGLHSQLGIDIFGVDARSFGYRNQVADLPQKRLVSRHISNRTGVRAVPGIEFGLQALALGQQGGVLGCQVGNDGIKTRPEGARLDAGSGQDFLLHKLVQGGGDIQAADGGAGGGHKSQFLNDKKRGQQAGALAHAQIESAML